MVIFCIIFLEPTEINDNMYAFYNGNNIMWHSFTNINILTIGSESLWRLEIWCEYIVVSELKGPMSPTQ